MYICGYIGYICGYIGYIRGYIGCRRGHAYMNCTMLYMLYFLLWNNANCKIYSGPVPIIYASSSPSLPPLCSFSSPLCWLSTFSNM